MSDDLKRIKERLERDPNSLLFAQYADLLRKGGELDKAIEIAEEGVRKHPEYATGFLVLGRCYKEKGGREKAIEKLEAATKLDQQSILALKELCELYMEQEDIENAKRILNHLLELDPLDREAKRSLRQIEEKAREVEKGGFEEKGLSAFFEEKKEFKKELEEEIEEEELELSDIFGKELKEEEETPPPEEGIEEKGLEEEEEIPTPKAGIEEKEIEGFFNLEKEEEVEEEEVEIGEEVTKEEPSEKEIESIFGLEEKGEEESLTAEKEAPEKGKREEVEIEEEKPSEEEVEVSVESKEEKISQDRDHNLRLGEIYERQGFKEKALNIYEKLYERDKSDEIKNRIDKIKSSKEVENLEIGEEETQGKGEEGILLESDKKAPIEKEGFEEKREISTEEGEEEEKVDDSFREWINGLSGT